MTGLEPIAIAGKVVESAVKAEAGEAKDRQALRELAKESGDLDPAARAYAKRLAVKEQIRMKIWQPLGMLFGISRDYFENEFADDMADRVAQIPDEDLVTPRLSVAGPTVQGIAFTVDEPALKAMYLNLLAAASDGRVASTVHPSFAEIIRQLSAEEAVVLGPVLQVSNHPIIEVRRLAATKDDPAQGYGVVATNIMDWHENGIQVLQTARALQIVNWQRLGLVQVQYDTHMTAEGLYAWAETHPLVTELRESLDTEDFKRVEIQQGVLTVTDFGRAFQRVVVASSTTSG